MSNKTDKPDAATLALWRAAEAGDFDEVETMLSRVADLNARNEHGMTALMRAAQHGNASVVRLLLAHGADANVVRNDKFTALSLAAFFGHTETVRVLMEHGADSKASTRHGTSAHMWATARTFNEVVDQLKKPAPPSVEKPPVTRPRLPEAQPPLLAEPIAPRPVTSAIVRTLKDPPEIWDLVHEEPPGFNASAAFMGHLQSMRRGLWFRLATASVLICASLVGVWVLRGAQARSEAAPEPPAKDSSAFVRLESEKKVVESSTMQPVEESTAAVATTENFRTPSTQQRRSHSSVARFRETEWEPAEGPATSESVQRIHTPIKKTNAPTDRTSDPTERTNVPTEKTNALTEKSDVKVRSESANQAKSSSPLSPQLITPAKNVTPKTKVIQWP
jgi:hypothetical protein